MSQSSNVLRVARYFSRATKTYDAHAHLQRRIGQQLLTYLSLSYAAQAEYPVHQCILELGTGTGYASQYLQQLFPDSTLLLQDISCAMLQAARYRMPQTPTICADFNQLPLPNASVDLIYTNMSLQWSLNWADTFQQLQHVLKPGGLLVFSLPVAGTFVELLESLRQVGRQGNTWMSHAQLAQLLQAQQWTVRACEQEQCTLFYRSVPHFIQELKSLGANCLQQAQSQSIMNRSDWVKLENNYNKYRNSQRGLPVSYQIVYGVVQK